MIKKIPKKNRFAICIDSDGCDDLQVWKIYRVLLDAKAAEEEYVRVVDESGEDYLYPAERFVFVELPRPTVKKLLAAHT